jgi:hypothetical protein
MSTKVQLFQEFMKTLGEVTALGSHTMHDLEHFLLGEHLTDCCRAEDEAWQFIASDELYDWAQSEGLEIVVHDDLPQTITVNKM